MNLRVYVIGLFTFLLSAPAFAQTSKSIELGTSLSELKCKASDRFLIIISHGSMIEGCKCSYDSMNYVVGVNPQNEIVFVSISDTNFIIEGIKYLKIKFKDLDEKVKSYIKYELPFAYYVSIDDEWFLAYSSNDTFVKNGKGFIKENALPKFAFKRTDISKSSSN